MKVIIVEDEYGAVKNLSSILKEIDNTIEIVKVADSVKDVHLWLVNNPSPDLGFFDIQLSDGNVFEIFNKIEILFPIIFTTAFSDFAIDAFKVNGIDYILKPLNKESVEFGINRFKSLGGSSIEVNTSKLLKALKEIDDKKTVPFKKSILIHYRDRLKPVETKNISFFFIKDRIVYAVTKDNKKYTIDKSLEELEKIIDPKLFMRVNRQYIINRVSIIDISLHFNSRYSVRVTPNAPEKIIVSKSKSKVIRNWLEY